MSRYRFLLRERLAQSRERINGRSPWRFELVLLACLLVGLTALICSRYLPSLSGFEEGGLAPRTIIAEKAVTVLDIEATDELKARVAELVTPIYLPDAGALAEATGKLQTFLEIAGRLRASLGSESDRTAALAVLRSAASETVSDATLEYLLAVPPTTADRIQSQTLGALETLYAGPITEDSLERVRSTLRSIADNVGGSEAAADAVYEITAGYLGPNQVIDEERTEARRNAAMGQVAPVMASVSERETVVRKGEMVSAQDILILKALGLVDARSGWKVWLGIFLISLLETVAFSRLVHRFNKAEPEFGNNMMLVLVVLLLGATAVARLLVIEPLSAYVIPVAALGMIVTVILNARSALLMVTLVSLNIGLLTDLDMRYALVALIVGSLALFLVSRVTKRATLLAVGLATMILAAFAIFVVELFAEATAGEALRSSLWGLANGFLVGVLAIVLLMLLETLFNLTTPLRLLELADPAHPLLKKLMQVAPGTYNHSIQMGNLAEAAAEAIGANTLLARVGAYYHDIGKTVRPEYFVENQIYVENPHERLSPSLSKLAITAHVRDGEHLGKVYGLPQPVVDIIKQHHGTSVLAFFYHKAVQSANDTVYEESYRYEEQKPQSKEASIIMLADSVEAAVRAMENPTRRKIQGLIQEIFKQKVEDGQLDESSLTQSDLHKVQESFDISLLGLVGHRIHYPDREPGSNRRAARGGGAGRPSGPPSATGLAPPGTTPPGADATSPAPAVSEPSGQPPDGGK
ncbi:MAG: HDIG domain-containing protein [Thermoleophilia bacterium]|nr:HDIG domain-containing protein [Thermoleophilia bacterium]